MIGQGMISLGLFGLIPLVVIPPQSNSLPFDACMEDDKSKNFITCMNEKEKQQRGGDRREPPQQTKPKRPAPIKGAFKS